MQAYDTLAGRRSQVTRPILRWTGLILFAVATAWAAGPVEFGWSEFRKAVEARGLRPEQFRIATEITLDPPESYSITPVRISGGDIRGLMYGLLAAAEQIRLNGRLSISSGVPRTAMRGIRRFLHNRDLEQDWYYSREYWDAYFAMLARNRFNRFNLVFAHQTEYLAPPYPFWVEVPGFSGIRARGLTAAERERNLEMLVSIGRSAQEHAIDFTLGIWEHNIQRGMRPSVDGLTADNIGPYSYAALKAVLNSCPVRSVQMRTNSESGIPAEQQVEFYRDYVFRALREVGRRVALDLRGWTMAGGLLDAAKTAGVPLRLSSKFWAEHLGRPYPPAETFAGYSYHDFLAKPRNYDFYWEIWSLGSHRLLLWGDPEYVRRAVSSFDLGGAVGFEIDAPLSQQGFGNQPGRWGIFTPEAAKDRVFWKYDFERYWMFYLLWGRLSYDPKTPEAVWLDALRQRFGPAAADALEAYQQSSRVLSTIVAAHMPDPNMYIWPEINPGGLIEDYMVVKPSDWRYVASIPEAVRNRVDRVASAKETPDATAARLDGFALAAEQAIARARAKVRTDSLEWRSTETDQLVLVSLARYHARKRKAAERLAWFDATGDSLALETAHREASSAVEIWESLVKLTDGVYPDHMAFGPEDAGHWKDKLPYVRHDLELLNERQRIAEITGHFDFGFDFGAMPAPFRPPAYRNDPYVLANHVAPGFRPADAKMAYNAPTGYGWAGEGNRETFEIPLSPYREVRAVSPDPKHLPRDVLFGDYVRGRGPQVFQVKTGPGDFQVALLMQDRSGRRSSVTADGEVCSIRFPEGEWKVSGLVLARSGRAAAETPTPLPLLPSPAFAHTPPPQFQPGQPLTLALKIQPSTAIQTVRLHYRAVNQLEKFRASDSTPAKPVFLIPAGELPSRFDLMYYFEVLTKDGRGWFYPDPDRQTPYFVVHLASPAPPADASSPKVLSPKPCTFE